MPRGSPGQMAARSYSGSTAAVAVRDRITIFSSSGGTNANAGGARAYNVNKNARREASGAYSKDGRLKIKSWPPRNRFSHTRGIYYSLPSPPRDRSDLLTAPDRTNVPPSVSVPRFCPPPVSTIDEDHAADWLARTTPIAGTARTGHARWSNAVAHSGTTPTTDGRSGCGQITVAPPRRYYSTVKNPRRRTKTPPFSVSDYAGGTNNPLLALPETPPDWSGPKSVFVRVTVVPVTPPRY